MSNEMQVGLSPQPIFPPCESCRALRSRLLALEGALEGVCKAAIKYDDAIRQCANDPDTMASHCTATGDTLDTLYDDWITKSRAALGPARGKEKGD